MNYRRVRSKLAPFLFLVTSAFFLVLLSCSGTGDSSVDATSGTGVVDFSVHFQKAASDVQPLAADLNCDGLGVSTIEAYVYDQTNTLLANGGAWECTAGQGTITSVEIGNDRTIVLVGKNAEGVIAYRGEQTVDVTANGPNNAGTISCPPFSPTQLTPANGTMTADSLLDIDYTWNAVAGASEYRILIWYDGDDSDPSINTTTTGISFKPIDLGGDAGSSENGPTSIEWQVFAVDSYGHEGAGSEIWSITRESIDWVSLAAGGNYNVAIKPDGTLWAWGYNADGQLGLGDTTNRSTPTQIGSDDDWNTVWAGWYHTLAMKTDGTLWAWGNNEYGQLGLGDTTNRSTPTQIGNDNDWDAIIGGFYHTLAKKTDDTIWVWGRNSSGQLGLGDTTDRLSPESFDPGTDWETIWAGGFHMLMKYFDGTFWGWGGNFYGQLGLGDTTDRSTPVLFDAGTDWEDAWLGGYHTLAKKTDGTLWAWGGNGFGQLGLGDTTDRSAPEQIGTDDTWDTAWSGAYHTLAKQSDGTLWAWGGNEYAQLGLGDTTNRSTPTQVGTDTAWETVWTGGYHTLAEKADGTLWVWGNNSYGQLGLGDTDSRDTPTLTPFVIDTGTD